MSSTNDLHQLIESREQEEIRLHILMSQRRKRKLDAIIAKESSAASTPVTQKRRHDLPDQAFLSVIWDKATQLHGAYAQRNALEKAFVFLTMNSIINLTFDYAKLANVNKERFDDYKKRNGFANPELRQVDRTILKNITEHATSEPPIIGRFVDCSIRLFPRASKEELTYYRIYSHFLMMLEYQKHSIKSWRTLSENDIFRLFVSPVLEIIFENSVVKLRSGETSSVASTEDRVVQAKAAGIRSREAIKMDLRLVLINDQTEYDLANCEFTKSGDIQRKVVTDNAKILVEGKCIMDSLVLNGRLSHEEAKKIQVVNLQACGLKMQLVALKLDQDGNGYVAQPIGSTIKLPTTMDTIPTFFQVGLPLLQYMKDVAEKNAMVLQDAFNRDSSSVDSQRSPHPTGFIKKTWLGPYSPETNSIPPIPY